jgi:uncharacterized membrane protein YkvA (DUF1232 family)
MSFAWTAFGRRGDDAPRLDERLRRDFWRKLRGVAAELPFLEDLLAAYYCALDRSTPFPVKATLVAAIAYFVLPFDAIPDVLPIIGFTDDAAMVVAAIRMVAGAITPEHRQLARERLQEFKSA